MCPELSQNVCQDHLSRVFYPETAICHREKLDQQHTFFLNAYHVPNRTPQYKLSEESAHGVAIVGSSAEIRSPTSEIVLGEHLQPSQVISIGMLGASHCRQETYTPLRPGVAEASADYSLDMSCDDNQLIQEIDCGWMKDVLDDLLLTSHDMPPLAPLSMSQCPPINLPSSLSPLGLTSKRELPADPPPRPLLPPSAGVTPQSVTSTSPGAVDSRQTCESVPAPAQRTPTKAKSSSPTPEPLKTRASKRLQKDESSRKVSKWASKANLGNAEQVEHVIRERQRRDDMSYKIATLESLLPQGPKRDRASVVHDSVQYVKLLQQRVEELTKKSAELHLKRRSKCTSSFALRKEEVRVGTAEELLKHCRLVNFHVQVEGGDDAAMVSNCRCRPHFMSLTMKALEQLQLDLCRSSITKMPDGTFFWVIASKPRFGASAVPSSSTLALKIKSAVELQ